MVETQSINSFYWIREASKFSCFRVFRVSGANIFGPVFNSKTFIKNWHELHCGSPRDPILRFFWCWSDDTINPIEEFSHSRHTMSPILSTRSSSLPHFRCTFHLRRLFRSSVVIHLTACFNLCINSSTVFQYDRIRHQLLSHYWSSEQKVIRCQRLQIFRIITMRAYWWCGIQGLTEKNMLLSAVAETVVVRIENITLFQLHTSLSQVPQRWWAPEQMDFQINCPCTSRSQTASRSCSIKHTPNCQFRQN